MTLQATRKNTLEEARAFARIESVRVPKFYYYIVWVNSGHYLVDYIGILFSDETLIETYKNGILI